MENEFICVMFQTTWAFEMKLKLQHAQVAANDFLYFDALAKYSPLNIISILIRVFENRFQDFQETHWFFLGGIIVMPFSVDINALHTHFQMEHIELQPDSKKNLVVAL